MSRIVHFDVHRGVTIMDGFESDKPSFGMRVELEEDDDFAQEVANAIDTVNSVLMLIPETGEAED